MERNQERTKPRQVRGGDDDEKSAPEIFSWWNCGTKRHHNHHQCQYRSRCYTSSTSFPGPRLREARATRGECKRWTRRCLVVKMRWGGEQHPAMWAEMWWWSTSGLVGHGVLAQTQTQFQLSKMVLIYKTLVTSILFCFTGGCRYRFSRSLHHDEYNPEWCIMRCIGDGTVISWH